MTNDVHDDNNFIDNDKNVINEDKIILNGFLKEILWIVPLFRKPSLIC